MKRFTLKNWNITSIIKTILIIIVCVTVFIPQVDYTPNRFESGFLGLAKLAVILSLILPGLIYFNKLFFNLKIEKPSWNDNPLILTKPLIFWHYAAYTFMSFGLCWMISDLIYFGFIQYEPIKFFMLGIGSLTGVYLTLWIKPLLVKLVDKLNKLIK
ncbi:MAG: hypothetical protein K8S14_07470 [Actinomycetia bacterium]|nr:hypothetical protein [Actinomycetes bacterium]